MTLVHEERLAPRSGALESAVRPLRILHASKSAAEFGYHEALVSELCARGHLVHAVFDEGYSQERSDRAVRAFAARTQGFSTGWAVRPRSVRRRVSTALQEAATLASYLQRTSQSPFYLERFERGMAGWLRRATGSRVARSLLRRPSAVPALLRIADRVPADRAVLREVAAFDPDLVIASPANMRHSFEAEYLRAAKALGIPTVIPVFSWDNLTTKSLFPVTPDRLLVWNETQRSEAAEMHHVSPGAAVVVGATLFDRWSGARLADRSREEFCARVGLEPDRPFVAYLGSTAGIAQDETWLVRALSEAAAAHRDPRVRELAVLVRPHPLHTAVYAALDDPRVRVWPRDGDFPDSLDALREFHDTLRFAVAAIGVNTTGMLDAVVVDRPCIAVLADRYRRTQEEAMHFQQLRRAGAVDEAATPEACLDLVAALLDGVDERAARRREFVTEFLRPVGDGTRTAGVAADAVEAIARRRR